MIDRLISNGVALLAGVVLVGAGLWLRSNDAREQATQVEVRGAVVDSVKRRDVDRKQDTFAPVIEYEAAGQKLRVTGAYETFRQSEGNPVVVRFDPANPEGTAHVIGALDGLVPAGVIALGAAGLLAGVVGLFRKRE